MNSGKFIVLFFTFSCLISAITSLFLFVVNALNTNVTLFKKIDSCSFFYQLFAGVYKKQLGRHFQGWYPYVIPISGMNFAGQPSYVNSFLLYESRFRVPLIVFVVKSNRLCLYNKTIVVLFLVFYVT